MRRFLALAPVPVDFWAFSAVLGDSVELGSNPVGDTFHRTCPP